MNSSSVLQGVFKTENELFLSKLSSYAIVDIGTIVKVINGRALVNGSSFIGGRQVVYQDAEIVFPGNSSGAFTADCAGTTCLIFIPCSCMPDTVTRSVNLAAPPYAKAGVKVMPIGNGASSIVRTYIDSLGAFNIATKKYSVSFREDAVCIDRNDASASLCLDEVGGLHIIKQGDNSTLYINAVDGTTETRWISKDKDVQWTDTLNTDGSRTSVQNDPQDEDADPLFSLSIEKTGKLTVQTAANVVFGTTGDTSVTIKGGNASVTVKKQDGEGGNASVDAEGDVTVQGNTIQLNGDSKRLVTYGELKAAMDKLWIAMTRQGHSVSRLLLGTFRYLYGGP